MFDSHSKETIASIFGKNGKTTFVQHFPMEKSLKPKMGPINNKGNPSIPMVKKWLNEFRYIHTRRNEAERSWHPDKVALPETIVLIYDMVLADRILRLRKILEDCFDFE